jgi:transposase
MYTVGMRPTSIDLRQRIVAARTEDGQSMGAIAKRFKIPKGTVQNILERYRDAGTVQPKPPNAGRKPAFAGEALQRLERDVECHSDATLEELRDRSGKPVSLVCIHNTLKKLGFSRKKNRYVRASSAAKT